MTDPVTVSAAAEVRGRIEGWRAAHQTVVLVPTMGNLHDGHLSLVRLARKTADRVVVSIYVNPTQFGPGEDFEHYPRTLDEDREKLAGEGGADVLFVPPDGEIYPFGIEDAVRVTLPALAGELCGASRPGHFDGVASVVCRLLNIVAPDALVLGRKDYQQLVLVERMTRDLGLSVRIVSAPTAREPDGVAMSSRNRYLTADERPRAPALAAALRAAQSAVRAGDADYARIERDAAAAIERAGLDPDYVAIRRAADLARPAPDDDPAALVVLGAALLGRARLIDNTIE